MLSAKAKKKKIPIVQAIVVPDRLEPWPARTEVINPQGIGVIGANARNLAKGQKATPA